MITKDNPFISRLLARSFLSKAGSTKSTFHLELEADPLLDYEPGDAIGILPSNDKKRVQIILSLLNRGGSEIVSYRGETFSLKDFLTCKANIDFIPLKLLNAFPHSYTDKNEMKAFAESHYLESLLTQFKERLPPLPLLVELLPPLLPRMYSIASSKRYHPKEIHLTVSALFYEKQGKTHIGVGSQFLCYEAEIGKTPIPFYVHKAPHFKLPKDPNASLILIGPGTGIAPYRAFLQERFPLAQTGKHWLFFGERQKAYDYYYETFWQEFQEKHFLEIDTAFSRDQAEKIYVQHKMQEKGAMLWKWLQEGAYLYICGDASSMAKEVQKTLMEIAKIEGNIPEEEAKHFLKNLRSEGRLSLDVY